MAFKIRAYVAVGSSLGSRIKALELARRLLSLTHGVELKRTSRLYWSKPLGGIAQGWFFNAVFEIDTTIKAEDLLIVLKKTELRVGRKLSPRWGDRLIDLDLLIYGDLVYQSETLQIPHPRMRERSFVMSPLLELRPNLIDPQTGSLFQLATGEAAVPYHVLRHTLSLATAV